MKKPPATPATQMLPSPEKVRLDQNAEVELMNRIATGDRVAFEELSARYGGLIYSTIHKVLNHYEDTRDVSQEVLLSIWKKAATFDAGKGKLLTWIATMSRNRAIDRVRTVQRRCALRDHLEERNETEPSDPGDPLRGSVYRTETRRILESAVLTLSAEQREVIELAYFSGLTQSQIAARIERPIGTVKARIRRGVQNLRGEVDQRFSAVEGLHLPVTE